MLTWSSSGEGVLCRLSRKELGEELSCWKREENRGAFSARMELPPTSAESGKRGVTQLPRSDWSIVRCMISVRVIHDKGPFVILWRGKTGNICHRFDSHSRIAITRRHHGLRNTNRALGGDCPRHQRDQDPARPQHRWRRLPPQHGREVDQVPRRPCLAGKQVPDDQHQHRHRIPRPHASRSGEARRLESRHRLQG